MKKFSILSIAAIWSLSSSVLFGAALVVAFDSGGLLLQNSTGVDLTGGNGTTNFDGEVIQVGYFSGAILGNDTNFVGTWIPLTGEGGAWFASNTAFDTTVGDDNTQGFGPPFNQYQISLNVDSVLQGSFPPVGTVLSIRIYDRPTLAASTSFMTLSNNLWKWPVATTLTDPTSRLDMTLADSGLRMENRIAGGGTISTPNGDPATPDGNGNLRTNVPIGPVIPEPSCSLLALAGCAAFLARRRK